MKFFYKIVDNIDEAIEIRKLAQKEKISFKAAKKKFKSLDKSIKERIRQEATKFGMPYYLIESMIIDDGCQDIKKKDIMDKVYKDYVCKNNRVVSKIGNYYEYVGMICKSLSNRIFYEDIIEIDNYFQREAEKIAEKSGVSILVANLIMIYGINKEQASVYAKSIEYCNRCSIPLADSIDGTYTKYLLNSNEFKRKKVRGIRLVSKTEDGLKKLEKIINKAFDRGDKQYREVMEKLIKNNTLILTDFDWNDSSCYSNSRKMIYLDTKSETEEKLIITFYHETSHFLDHVIENNINTYSNNVPVVRKVFEKIRMNLNNSSVESIISNPVVPLSIKKVVLKVSSVLNLGLYKKGVDWKEDSRRIGLLNEYINNERLNKKWKEEIEIKYASYSEEDKERKFRQKLLYERQKYINLIVRIYDIYDGLSKGRLYKYFKTYGHGVEYYSWDGKDVIEFIANVGAIYNSDGLDLLEYEFGVDLAHEIIQIYKDLLVKCQNVNNNLSNGEQKNRGR